MGNPRFSTGAVNSAIHRRLRLDLRALFLLKPPQRRKIVEHGAYPVTVALATPRWSQLDFATFWLLKDACTELLFEPRAHPVLDFGMRALPGAVRRAKGSFLSKKLLTTHGDSDRGSARLFAMQLAIAFQGRN